MLELDFHPYGSCVLETHDEEAKYFRFGVGDRRVGRTVPVGTATAAAATAARSRSGRFRSGSRQPDDPEIGAGRAEVIRRAGEESRRACSEPTWCRPRCSKPE